MSNQNSTISWEWRDLQGEVKGEIASIGTSSMFYVAALKTLKREYRIPLLLTHLKLKKLFDQSQIKNQDYTAIREYYHYEHSKDCTIETASLIDSEKWHLFSPIANIISIEIRSNNFSNTKHTNNSLLCWLCRGSHKLHQRDTFKKKKLSEKKICVGKDRLCWNCPVKGNPK